MQKMHKLIIQAQNTLTKIRLKLDQARKNQVRYERKKGTAWSAIEGRKLELMRLESMSFRRVQRRMHKFGGK